VLWPKDAGRVGWRVYAILDAARDPRVRPAVLGSGQPHVCLYSGKVPEPILAVAPYLVELAEKSPFTASLLEEGWGESWGVFTLSAATLEELRRHLKRLLKVEGPRGETMLFRFYDPRVLRVYLPTCTAAELGAVFGPVGMFALEGASSAEALRFHRADDRLHRASVTLAPG
jgi:hypothetical protein